MNRLTAPRSFANQPPFGDSVELPANSGLPSSALIEGGRDHRLADPEPLEALEALLRAVAGGR